MAQKQYLTLIESNTTLPIDLESVKEHLGIVGTDDDARIQSYIWAAIDHLERATGNSYSEKTWLLTLNGFPTLVNWMELNLLYWNDFYPWYSRMANRSIVLPFPPTQPDSVEIQYYNVDNTIQTWETNKYRVQYPSNDNAMVNPVEDYPATYNRPDSVQILFTTVASLPKSFELLVKNMVAMFNENREGQWDFSGIDRFIHNLKQAGY